ncbi:hypothetical protein B0H13DRAFT_1918564, partial [Mycena leptocephala]
NSSPELNSQPFSSKIGSFDSHRESGGHDSLKFSVWLFFGACWYTTGGFCIQGIEKLLKNIRIQKPTFNGPGQGQGFNPPYNNTPKAQNPTPGQGLRPMQMPPLTGSQGHGQGWLSFSGHRSGSSAEDQFSKAPYNYYNVTAVAFTGTFKDARNTSTRSHIPNADWQVDGDNIFKDSHWV